jgi:hypothetical protein
VYSIGASVWIPPPPFGGGGGNSGLITVLCQTYFVCKFVHGCMRTVHSEPRVYVAPNI